MTSCTEWIFKCSQKFHYCIEHRVAPLKLLTLPKLELMGALTATRLCNFIVQALQPLSLPTYFWSDSQITLHWIKEGKHTSTFASHRVVEILRFFTPDQCMVILP